MGGSQSTEQVGGERVTLEKLSEDAYNVVHLSEEVVDRLQYGRDQQSSPPQTRLNVDNSAIEDALDKERVLTNRLKQDLNYATRDMNVLKERIRNMETSGDGKSRKQFADKSEYMNKLEDLTARQEELQRILTDKFNETVIEVSDRFFSGECELVCQQLETPLMQCYMDNPKHTLRCSELSSAFIKCVTEKRADFKARQRQTQALQPQAA